MPKLSLSIFLTIALLLASLVAAAHDPGMSRAELTLQHDRAVLRLVFSSQDIESLNPLRRISHFEDSTTLLEDLESLQGATLHVDGKNVSAEQFHIEAAPGDAVHVRAEYFTSLGDEYLISIPILAELPRGHRLYLRVRDQAGTIWTEALLSAQNREMGFSRPDVVRAAPWASGFVHFVQEGIWHIWIGVDHLAFLVLLLLPIALAGKAVARTRQPRALFEIAKIVTAFTLAHSVTLILATMGVLALPQAPVEIAIAGSVVVAGLLNLYRVFHGWKIAFGFGLIHGFGFAGVLSGLDLHGEYLILKLAGFNLGVEIGQLAVVLIVVPVLGALGRLHDSSRILVPAFSLFLTVIASFWLLERSYA